MNWGETYQYEMMLFQMAIYYQRKKFSRESLAIDPNHTFS